MKHSRYTIRLRTWPIGGGDFIFWEATHPPKRSGAGLAHPQESTGCPDCNGDEIYRGDIVEVKGDKYYTVEFGRGAYYLNSLEDGVEPVWLHAVDQDDLKIAGNPRDHAGWLTERINEKVRRFRARTSE